MLWPVLVVEPRNLNRVEDCLPYYKDIEPRGKIAEKGGS